MRFKRRHRVDDIQKEHERWRESGTFSTEYDFCYPLTSKRLSNFFETNRHVFPVLMYSPRLKIVLTLLIYFFHSHDDQFSRLFS